MELETVTMNPSAPSKSLELEEKQLDERQENAKLVSAFHDLTPRQALFTFKKNVFICLLVLFITANDGYQLTVPGNIIANPGFIEVFGVLQPNGKKALAAKTISAWSGFYNAGYIAILLVASFPNDYFGRKAGMLCLGLSCVLATIISLVATTWPVWGVAKIFNGFAVGFAQATLTAYVSELAPTQIRGALLNVYSIFFAVGQFAAAICLYALQIDAPTKYKRALQTEWIFSGIFLFIWLYIPESPQWYIRKGKPEQAKKVLQRVNGGVKGYNVEYEFSVMEQNVKEGMALAAAQSSVNWTSIYRGVNLRRTFVSFFPLALQQLIGIPVVFGYTSIFFQAAGLANPFVGTVIVYILLIAFIFVSFSTVEYVGRRKLFLTNGGVMIVALAIIGAMGCIKQSAAVSNVTIVMMCLWVAAYATSAGPLGYAYLGESSTVALRAKTTGHAAAGTGLFGLIFGYTTPYMLAAWSLKTGFFYAGTAFVSLIIFYFTIPETKGRSYAELDDLFQRRIPARQFAKTKAFVSSDAPGQA